MWLLKGLGPKCILLTVTLLVIWKAVLLQSMEVRSCISACCQRIYQHSLAGAILIENSTLSDSLRLQGVVAQGLNSKVFLINSSISNCNGTCVLALQGGCMDIQSCNVFSSTSMQGVCAQGKGSRINMANTRIYGNPHVFCRCGVTCIVDVCLLRSCRLHANLCGLSQR